METRTKTDQTTPRIGRAPAACALWLALAGAACGGKESAPSASTPAAVDPSAATEPAPGAVPEPEPASDPAPSALAPAPDDLDPEEPEAGDTPHLDRALRVAMPREGDLVRGRGFTIEGVPDDVTWYWPDDTGPERIYLAFDAVYEHVATVRELEDPSARAPADRPGDVRLEDTGRPFAVWPSSLAPSQKKRGPGKAARFPGRGYRYELETLVLLPWLVPGFRFTPNP